MNTRISLYIVVNALHPSRPKATPLTFVSVIRSVVHALHPLSQLKLIPIVIRAELSCLESRNGKGNPPSFIDLGSSGLGTAGFGTGSLESAGLGKGNRGSSGLGSSGLESANLGSAGPYTDVVGSVGRGEMAENKEIALPAQEAPESGP